MNLKLAKRLRRFARQVHATMPEPGEVGTYVQHKVTKAIHCAQNSPRGVYRRLKKDYQREESVRTIFDKKLPE